MRPLRFPFRERGLGLLLALLGRLVACVQLHGIRPQVVAHERVLGGHRRRRVCHHGVRRRVQALHGPGCKEPFEPARRRQYQRRHDPKLKEHAGRRHFFDLFKISRVKAANDARFSTLLLL